MSVFAVSSAFADTTAPILISPLASTLYHNNIAISYTLPDTPQAGSVHLIFTNITSGITTTNITMSNDQAVSFTLNPDNIALSSLTYIIAETSNVLPAAAYDVTISYQNVLGNPAATAAVHNIYLNETPTPSLATTLSLSSYSPQGGVPFTYTLPATPETDSALIIMTDGTHTHSVTLPNTSGSDQATTVDINGYLPDGTYNAILSYQDAFGDPAATASVSNIVVLSPSATVSDVTATEDADSVDVGVTLTGLSASAITLDYATVDGTATDGVDYTNSHGTLTWAAGETGAKTISIPLLSVSGVSSNRNLTLNLSNPSGTTLTTSSATVTIPHTASDSSGGGDTPTTPTVSSASGCQLIIIP